MYKRCRIFFLIVFTIDCFASGALPVRGQAIGGAYSAASNDALAITWNPAAGWARGWGYAVEYNKLYMGFDDNLYRGQISGYRDFGGYGFGLSLANFGADMYSRTEIGLAGKKAFGPFSVGVRPKYIFDGFNSSNFHYVEGDDPNDPLYRDGTGTSSFGLDAGAVFELSDRLSFGLSAQDIIAPSLGQEEAVAEPTDLRLGSRYSIESIKTNLSGEFGFALNAPDGEELSFGFGIESYALSDWLGLRVGVSNSAFGAGIGIEIPQLAGLGLDITYSKPFDDPGKVANTLQFGIRGNIVPPEKESNLTVRCSATPEVIALDDSALIEIDVTNTGDDNCGAFALDLKTNGESIRSYNLPGLDGGEDTTLIVYYSSDKGGEISFTIEADALDAIAESNEDDNGCETGFRAVLPPEVEILATPSILRLRTISYTYQDEGVVPAVFFEQNKDKIDSRFDDVVSLIAGRVADNPNVILEIKGYIGQDESNENLARSRAEAVKAELLKLVPGAEDRIIIPEEWDIERLRVPKSSLRKEDNIRLVEENRRVEFFVKLNPDIRTEIPSGGDPSSFVATNNIKTLLENNTDFVLVVAADNTSSDVAKALKEATVMRDKVLRSIGGEYDNQVLASAARMPGKSNNITLSISADGVLYKPRVIHASKEFDPKDLPDCRIALSQKSEGITNWSVDLLNADGSIQQNIAMGKGNPPANLNWDFRDDEGNLIPIDKEFTLSYSLTDELGQRSEAIAENKVKTEIEVAEQRSEKLLLVQFEFDKPAAQSRFLEDRLAMVAGKVIRTIENSSKTTVIIEGHSDIIGQTRRNKELSGERAKAVLDQLKLAMAVTLGLDERGLKDWLAEHNAKILSEGYADSVPYTIESWESGAPVEKLVGDNDLPEGRSINRRVLVTIDSEK